MLELSTKYAIKALLHLAKLDSDEYIQVQSLSEKTKIPGPYLSKLIKVLAARGIVDTKRGSLGGVRFPDKKSITFLEVCAALEDPIQNPGCFLNKGSCNGSNPCVMHKHWLEMKEHISDFLKDKEIVRNSKKSG